MFLDEVILTGTLSKRNVDVNGFGYNLTLIQTKDPSKTHSYSWCYFQANGGGDDFSLPGCMKIAELVEINTSICL